MQRFIAVEHRHRLFSLETTNGLPIWWFVRERLFQLLQRQHLGNGGVGATAADDLSVASQIAKVWDYLRVLNRPAPKHNVDVLALSSSGLRRAARKGRGYNLFFDWLEDETQVTYGMVEFPDRSSHHPRPYTTNILYGDVISMRGNIGRRVAPRLSDRSVKELVAHIEMAVNKFGFVVHPNYVKDVVISQIGFAQFAYGAAQRLLDKTKPKVLLVTCGYAPTTMIMQYCAKQRGIPVVELQHGFIYDGDLGYRLKPDDDVYLSGTPFPDSIWLFGQHFEKIVKENARLLGYLTEVVGHPFLWSELNSSADRPTASKARTSVLVTTQPGLQHFWADFIREIATKAIGFEFIIKPHPGEAMWVERVYGELRNLPNVTLTDESSVYRLLRRAEYHMSVHSTVHLEAIAFGLKDVIIRPPGSVGMFDFLNELGVPSVSGPEEAVSVLRNYPDTGGAREYVRQDIFRLDQDPYVTMRRLLQGYLQ